jgi:hypothetical protein
MLNRPRPCLGDCTQEHPCEEVLALRHRRWRPSDTHVLTLLSTIAVVWLFLRHGADLALTRLTSKSAACRVGLVATEEDKLSADARHLAAATTSAATTTARGTIKAARVALLGAVLSALVLTGGNVCVAALKSPPPAKPCVAVLDLQAAYAIYDQDPKRMTLYDVEGLKGRLC